MSPFGLAKDIFGLAEVVCVYTKYDPFIKIVDRNQQMINIDAHTLEENDDIQRQGRETQVNAGR